MVLEIYFTELLQLANLQNVMPLKNIVLYFPVSLISLTDFTCSCHQALVQRGLKADEWLKGLSHILGGKSGGKAMYAQCSGPNIEQVSQAVEAAKKFARLKLK